MTQVKQEPGTAGEGVVPASTKGMLYNLLSLARISSFTKSCSKLTNMIKIKKNVNHLQDKTSNRKKNTIDDEDDRNWTNDWNSWDIIFFADNNDPDVF